MADMTKINKLETEILDHLLKATATDVGANIILQLSEALKNITTVRLMNEAQIESEENEIQVVSPMVIMDDM